MRRPSLDTFRNALRSRVFWVFVGALVLLVLVGRSTTDDKPEPLDPQSTSANGTRAAVLTLQQLGMQVDIDARLTGQTALLLRDDLTTDQRSAVEEWVRTGGTLVLADSSSDLANARPVAAPDREPRTLTPSCSASWVRGIENIEPANDRNYPLLDLPSGAVGCFPVNDDGFAVVQYPVGLGQIIQVSTPEVFTNRQLGKHDNAVLLAAATGAKPGASLVILQPDLTVAPDTGEEVLSDLIPANLKQAAVQLLIATVILALWRGRRLGRLVYEPQPVELPASSLVLAVGELLQQAGQSTGAGRVLRKNLHRRLAELIGVSAEVPPGVLAQLVAQRTGIDERRLAMALVDAPVGNGEALLALAQTIENVHREAANAR